jgi:hypothetical protein
VIRRGFGDLDALDPEVVEGAAELGVVVADQEACRNLTLGELPDKVSRLLGDPGAVRVLGHPGEVDATGRDLG